MNLVEDKIAVLRDFKILTSKSTTQEATLRNILTLCKTDVSMDQKVYNVLHNNETLKDLLKRATVKMPKADTGYTLGDAQYYELVDALKVFNAEYDKDTDTFTAENGDKFKGYGYLTVDGVKHLYCEEVTI